MSTLPLGLSTVVRSDSSRFHCVLPYVPLIKAYYNNSNAQTGASDYIFRIDSYYQNKYDLPFRNEPNDTRFV